ncbi:hypothetical protein HK405_003036 [Cladochytrium tenue]|nr:hypothetical protein HK405_003036 [Cladochytrium tenue]
MAAPRFTGHAAAVWRSRTTSAPPLRQSAHTTEWRTGGGAQAAGCLYCSHPFADASDEAASAGYERRVSSEVDGNISGAHLWRRNWRSRTSAWNRLGAARRERPTATWCRWIRRTSWIRPEKWRIAHHSKKLGLRTRDPAPGGPTATTARRRGGRRSSGGGEEDYDGNADQLLLRVARRRRLMKLAVMLGEASRTFETTKKETERSAQAAAAAAATAVAIAAVTASRAERRANKLDKEMGKVVPAEMLGILVASAAGVDDDDDDELHFVGVVVAYGLGASVVEGETTATGRYFSLGDCGQLVRSVGGTAASATAARQQKLKAARQRRVQELRRFFGDDLGVAVV